MNISKRILGTTLFACTAVVAAFGAVSAPAEEVYRAHYEIRVASQGADNKVRSTFETRPGQPFTLSLPPNVVAMSVRRILGESYELEVKVMPAPATAKGQTQPSAPTGPAIFSQVYSGNFGRPLELKSGKDGVAIDGAISVVVLNR